MTFSEPMPAAPVLEMTDVAVVSLHLPNVVVLEQVNWTVRPHECWIVGAPPASGKSDLLTTAAGLMRPRSGRHRLFGQDLADGDEDDQMRIKLRVGVVFGQGGRLFNHLSIAENLALPYCYHRNCRPTAAEERVSFVLEALDLERVALNTPGSIHRSLRHRVALGRALVLSPEVLFLDNPLAGLDPREARWWLDCLHGLLEGHPLLEKRKVTLIVGTEDLQPWGEYPCQYALIQNRRFTAVGSRSELLERHGQSLPELMPVSWLRKPA